MLAKTLLVTLAAVASIASAASPPACLLGAVNNYDDVSDITGICKEKDATSQIAKTCGEGKTSAALSAFADICNEAGVEVSTKIASSSGTKTGTATLHQASATGYFNGTGSGSAQSTGSPSGTGAIPTTTAGAGAGPSGTATGTGAPISTGAASAMEMSFGVLFAGMGFLAVAL